MELVVNSVKSEVAYDGDYGDQLGFIGLLMIRSGTSPQLIRNVRRYDLPYAEAKAKIDELMAL